MALVSTLGAYIQICRINGSQGWCIVEKKLEHLKQLEKKLGYTFSDQNLLLRALIHVSAAEAQSMGSYQRLEFLGDRVLGLAVSNMLYREFPQAPEGELSRRLAELVRKETCADIAESWGLGKFMCLGIGEKQQGGRKNRTILADLCESVLGAVFLDGGFDSVCRLIEDTFTERLKEPRRPLQDAKTALQEWVQGQGYPPPCYELVNRSGPDHSPSFTIHVKTLIVEDGAGEGASKREAEQNAARNVLLREHVWE